MESHWSVINVKASLEIASTRTRSGNKSVAWQRQAREPAKCIWTLKRIKQKCKRVKARGGLNSPFYPDLFCARTESWLEMALKVDWKWLLQRVPDLRQADVEFSAVAFGARLITQSARFVLFISVLQLHTKAIYCLKSPVASTALQFKPLIVRLSWETRNEGIKFIFIVE